MAIMNTALTAERLRKVLRYDPETGLLVRLTSRPKLPVGSVAGVLNSRGYVVIGIGGCQHRAHRLAWLYMTGEWPRHQVDHINGDRADNRWANLREATNAQNSANACRGRNNTSGFKGVSRDSHSGRWLACIMIHRRQQRLGYFNTAEEAHAAYIAKARELFGEFARVA